VSRDEIMTTVWDENWWGSTKTLDTHVGWLRRKLGDPPVLSTVRGVGFRFEAE
jgi:DNA-binding response OmpR family regulator